MREESRDAAIDRIVVEVPLGSFEGRRMKKNVSVIEAACSKVLGEKCSVVVAMEED